MRDVCRHTPDPQGYGQEGVVQSTLFAQDCVHTAHYTHLLAPTAAQVALLLAATVRARTATTALVSLVLGRH
jgi:hypothetical protein